MHYFSLKNLLISIFILLPSFCFAKNSLTARPIKVLTVIENQSYSSQNGEVNINFDTKLIFIGNLVQLDETLSLEEQVARQCEKSIKASYYEIQGKRRKARDDNKLFQPNKIEVEYYQENHFMWSREFSC